MVPPERGGRGRAYTACEDAWPWRILGRMRSYARRLGLVLLLGVSAVSAPACEGSEQAIAPNEPWPAGLPRPADVAEAQAQKAAGAVWSDRQVRQYYLERVAAIGGADEALRGAGESTEERARAAYAARHAARMTARAMMQDAAAVEGLQARDREKYGNPDGPTFEYLLERGRQKGLAGDELYQSIIDSAQRTDAATNRSMGF